MKILYRIAEYEKVPKWWLGVAYREWDTMLTVWAPVPLNYLIRWAVTLRNRWDIWRGRRGSFDMTLQKAITAIVETEHRAFEMKLTQQKKDAFELGISYVLVKVKQVDPELASELRNEILMDLAVAQNETEHRG